MDTMDFAVDRAKGLQGVGAGLGYGVDTSLVEHGLEVGPIEVYCRCGVRDHACVMRDANECASVEAAIERARGGAVSNMEKAD